MTRWVTTTQQQCLRHLADTADRNELAVFLRTTVQSYIEQHGESCLDEDLLYVAFIGQRNLTASSPGVTETIQIAGKEGGANPVVEVVSLAAARLFITPRGAGNSVGLPPPSLLP